MQFLIVLGILTVVVLIVSAPLRRARVLDGVADGPNVPETSDAATEIASLDAAREAKYHEIRDAELDHRTGKLSDADYEATNRALRAEAMEILRAHDAAQRRS